MDGINELQSELRSKHPRTGSVEEWWNNANQELKDLIAVISFRMEMVSPDTPWSDKRIYGSMLRTKQRKAIDRCSALLSYDWTVVDGNLIKFK